MTIRSRHKKRKDAIIDEKEWGILAESEHYYIKKEYEDASLYRKPDSKHIACVGDFYGDPEDAYIDPEERFCITIGCGIIKYMILKISPMPYSIGEYHIYCHTESVSRL